ncbi:MAG: ABC transporter substrate-binding protein [Hyphomicrobiaceae bacterium]
MKTHTLKTLLAAGVTCLTLGGGAFVAAAQTPIRVGFCAKTMTPAAAAAFAIATKMGWFAKEGVKVEMVAIAGSGDCVKAVATKDVLFSVPSVEPLAVITKQGVKAKTFYTAYQGNIYGFAVPDDSPIKSAADLRGKKIGLISMGSAGLIVARALVQAEGMNPDKDVSIVVAGEGAQTAALLRSKQIDALSQFDTQYALVENAGIKMRLLPRTEIEKFPSNGFVALEETLTNRRKDAIAVAKGYAMGSVFAIANPEAAVRIFWEIYPQSKAVGKDEATALKDDVNTLNARLGNLKLEAGGAKKWGESVESNYQAYLDWLLKQGVLKEASKAGDLITNDLIDEINAFDIAAVQKQAKDWKP